MADPKIRIEAPYNPLAKENLGKSVADALLERSLGPLPPQERFIAAGIYAIYYNGPFKFYAPLVERNRAAAKRGLAQAPIYIGKAVPAGARKGGVGLGDSPGLVLYNRLCEHADSIQEANSTLNLDHFRCRYLAVEDIWIPLGESMLIDMFNPLWNKVLDGFGNHDAGKGATINSGRLTGEEPYDREYRQATVHNSGVLEPSGERLARHTATVQKLVPERKGSNPGRI